jgi:phosphohistidine phosphatase
MELVLWRHADAEPGMLDMKRSLTDKGRRQADRVAKWLRPRLEGRWEILVSPAARAIQTADALGMDYEVRPALGTSATADMLLREAGWPARDRNVVIVGHQPTLGNVAARLLTGHPGDLGIKKGAVWWFTGKLDRHAGLSETILRAVIAPDFADQP